MVHSLSWLWPSFKDRGIRSPLRHVFRSQRVTFIVISDGDHKASKGRGEYVRRVGFRQTSMLRHRSPGCGPLKVVSAATHRGVGPAKRIYLHPISTRKAAGNFRDFFSF
ncbi:hypothetical protein GW17_00041523 [Ensete ventricosum]|nr:hypothetical protein GW17_00041523 [Ensete ventricosum]